MRRPYFTLAALVAPVAACLALYVVVGPRPRWRNSSIAPICASARAGNGMGRQITLGLNKSMIIELPREVREGHGLQSWSKMEAVLQTSTRAYLIGKAPGEANIIFVDKDGRQVVTLEITVERDLSALAGLLNRLIRGANIRVETVSGSVILSGTVQNAIDATRAGEIATQVIGVDPNASPTTTSSSSARTSPPVRVPAANRQQRPRRPVSLSTCSPWRGGSRCCSRSLLWRWSATSSSSSASTSAP